MKKKIYYICLVAIFFFGLSLWAWFKVPGSHSDAERRALSQFPAISKESVLNGEFMTDFESYTLDQFPLRDTFRSIKAFSRMQLFRQKDNNDIYVADGYVSKMEYPMNDNMLDLAGEKFQTLYNSYMKDTDVNVFFSIVPDKNYYLAEQNGYLSMDYDAFFNRMQELTPYMKFIDLREQLSIEDYYYTDTHWKQENLLPVAETLVAAMNNVSEQQGENASGEKSALNWQYEKKIATEHFKGVYVGQSALNLEPESLSYLTNEKLEACKVTSYSTGKAKDIFMYQLDKVSGKDPYEMFLNGTEALLTIENPNATTDKELVVFRDSFGSSLIPLLVENYSKITVVDIRYMDSSVLGNFVEFSNQDVLFLYSTLVLNASSALRVTAPEVQPLSFADFKNREFYFTSGAGAWRTVLTIDEDGSFTGEYFDAEMGAGKCYQSNFSGQFAEPVKVNDYTYSLEILELNYEKEVGTEEQKEDYLYVYSEAYGIADTNEVLIYLPGAPLVELPEEYKSWVGYPISQAGDNVTLLPFYGLYNEATQCGFYSYDIIENLYDFIESQRNLAASLGETLSNDSLSQDKIDDYTYQVYMVWDVALNKVWNVLEQLLDEKTFDKLRDEQLYWISDKELVVKATESIAKNDNPSTATAKANRKAAELTRERLYELLEYFETR